MTQRTVLVIFGTRPEAIKLFPVVRALADQPALRVRTCVTAQHRGLLDQVLAIADLAPDIDLDLMEPGQTLDRLTARLLTGLGEVMDAERPDLVVVQGDTATAMAGTSGEPHPDRVGDGHGHALDVAVAAGVLGSAARGVFAVALYRYASGAGPTGPFTAADLERAVARKA